MSAIPFNRPAIVGNELEYIAQSILQGQISGDGVFTKKVHSLREVALGVPKVLLTTSCTHALENDLSAIDQERIVSAVQEFNPRPAPEHARAYTGI